MKLKSPMAMKKEVKSDPKKKSSHTGQRPMSAMERYAQQRNASMKAAAQTTMMEHDPQSDVYHLQKAAEINGDESRKRAARQHAAKTIKRLSKIMK